MHERRRDHRNRTLKSGRIVFNDGQSVIDCLVRNLSDSGACLQVNSTAGIPQAFELFVANDSASRPCKIAWHSETRAGIEFCAPGRAAGGCDASASHTEAVAPPEPGAPSVQSSSDGDSETLRRELLRLRAALDEVPLGIVLVDANARAEFINRAFRQMWRLPDDKADSAPPFVALLYHGRDTNAYAVPPDHVDAYVAARVAHVEAGDPTPLDLRLNNGEVVRMQCTVLPSGGRMLCYTYVTDIVRHSDELEMLRAALDQMQPGVMLLDERLNARFMNRAVRDLWRVADEKADRKPSFAELVADTQRTGTYGVPADALSEYIANRIAVVHAGDPTPMDIPHGDGRMIRAQCAILPNGGRMLTYNDVSDLVRRADRFEQLAILDGMTGLYNRRHFEVAAEVEWSRFQRYHRPLSLMVIDIDRFKQINDGKGHEAGDRAIAWVAALCAQGKRATDVAARIGGDEFAILLPETNLEQASVVAERLRESIVQRDGRADAEVLSISIGIAAAALSMPGVGALMRLADSALYQAKAAGRDCVRCAADPPSTVRETAAE
jgi:diguanylate cyclase (GGDEF)-like protein